MEKYSIVCYHSHFPVMLSAILSSEKLAHRYIDMMLNKSKRLMELGAKLGSLKEYEEKESDDKEYHNLLKEKDIFEVSEDYDIIPINIREEE